MDFRIFPGRSVSGCERTISNPIARSKYELGAEREPRAECDRIITLRFRARTHRYDAQIGARRSRLARRLVSRAGPCVGARYDSRAKGTDEVDIHIDDENKIDGLFFRAPKLKAASLDAALHDLAVLERMPGLLSFVVMEGRSQRAALNASAPLAVGSTFKLALLAVLRARIDAGSMHWSDVVALDPRRKSLPSGIMQTWPDRTPTTLATYVTQMISTPQQIDAWRSARASAPR